MAENAIEGGATNAWQEAVIDKLPPAEALAGVVQRHVGPLVLLSGHTHEAFDARLGEAYLYGAPSTYYGIVHEGDTWSYAPDVIGARIVELAADGRVSSTLVTPDRL